MVDMSITQLRQLSNPGRAYLWEFYVPLIPGRTGSDSSDFIRLHVKNVQIPGFTVDAIEIPYGDDTIKVPGRRSVPAVSFQLEESEEGLAIASMLAWHRMCVAQAPITGALTSEGASLASRARSLVSITTRSVWNRIEERARSFVRDTIGIEVYKTDAYFILLTTEGEEYKRIKACGCWPSDMAPVALDFTASETIKVEITLQCDYVVEAK